MIHRVLADPNSNTICKQEKDARKELLALLEEEAERSGLLSSAVEGSK